MQRRNRIKRSLAILVALIMLLTSTPAFAAPDSLEAIREGSIQPYTTGLTELSAPAGNHVLDFDTWALGPIHNATDSVLDAQPAGPFASVTSANFAGSTAEVHVRDHADGFRYLRGATGTGGASRDLNFNFAPETERVLVAFRVRIEGPQNMAMVHVGGGTATDLAATSQINFSLMNHGPENPVPGNERALAHRPGIPAMQLREEPNTNTNMQVRYTRPADLIWHDVVIDFRMDGDRGVVSGLPSVTTPEALAGGDWLGNQYALYVNGQRSFSPVAAQRPLEFYLWPNFGFRGTNNDREGINFFRISTGGNAAAAVNVADVMVIGADDLALEGHSMWAINQPDAVSVPALSMLPSTVDVIVDGELVAANVAWDTTPFADVSVAQRATRTLTGTLHFDLDEFPGGVTNLRNITPQITVTFEPSPVRTPAMDIRFQPNPADIPLALRPIQTAERVNATIVAPQTDGSLYYEAWDSHDSRALGAAAEEDGRYVLEGNIMPDFSHVGFREGNEDIPFLDENNSYVVRLYPIANRTETDCDTDRIHAAIAQVAAQPVNPAHGFKGVVEFAPGTFWVTGPRGIELNESGVVLRGSGQGPDGTVIAYAHRPGHGPPPVHNWRNLAVAITMGNPAEESFGPFNEGYFGPHNYAGSGTPYGILSYTLEVDVAPGWYPVGASRLTLESTTGLSVDDRISILRLPSRDWVHIMNRTTTGRWGWPGMAPGVALPGHTDVLPGGTLADAGELHYPLEFERRIVAIEGNDIILNMPLVHGFNIPQDDAATVRLLDETNRVINVGVENMRIVAVRETGTSVNTTEPTQRGGVLGSMSDNRGRTAIRVIGTRDGFIRDTTSLYFPFAHTNIYHNASHISVLNNSYLSPAVFQYSARLYGITIDNGNNTLVDGNYAQGARYEVVTGAAIGGPNVFLDTMGEGSKIGPENHHRWATGTLFDNVQMIAGNPTIQGSNNTNGNVSLGFAGATGGEQMGVGIGRIVVQNRGANGSGHGWTGNTSVIWNPLAAFVQISRPPTGQNFVEGSFGQYNTHTRSAQGDAASAGAHANQTAQVAALRAMYGMPHIVNPTNAENAALAVYPSSLYRAQVSERFTGYYWNAVPSRPILQRPAPDTWVPTTFEINGVHDIRAEAVSVFINGVFYDEAVLGNADNRHLFALTVTLAPGYHKIAVTQTIDGIESHLTAQRSIHAGGVNTLTNVRPAPRFEFTPENAATQNMIDPALDATLRSLSVVSEDGEENEVVHELTPIFHPDTLEYTVNVPNAAASADIMAVTSHAGATVVVTRPAANLAAPPVIVTNPATLAVGSNEFTVTVTSGNGAVERVYTVEIIRGAPIPEFTVTFDLAGGTRTGGGALVQSVQEGQAAVAPEVAPPEGYRFVRWDHAFTNVAGAITVRAVWVPVITGHAPNTWFEAVWFEWPGIRTASFTAQISANGGTTWTNVDSELIRFLDDEHGARWRVDVPGLPANDGQAYSLRIMHGSSELHRLDGLTPREHARYGHAFIREPVTVPISGRTWHFPHGTTGGNTPDGGIAPGTEIWYITNDNLYMLDYLSHRTDPLIVRFLGLVGDPANGILPPGRTFQNKVMIENSANITFEGVGYETMIWGIGFCVHNSANIIFRNLEMEHATHDAIWLLGPVTHVWITNNTFHVSGDGSTDNTMALNFTISYNQYIGTRQTGLSNGDGAMQDGEATYFRNWYYWVASRTPMMRNTNAWIFNNFFDHNGENAITHRHGSSVIAEGNVIRSGSTYSNAGRGIPHDAPRVLLGGQGTALSITYEGIHAPAITDHTDRHALQLINAQAQAGYAQHQITVDNLRALEADPRAHGRTFSGGTFSANPAARTPSTDAELQAFIDSLVPNDLGTNAATGLDAVQVGTQASGGASRLWLPTNNQNLQQRLVGSIYGTYEGPTPPAHNAAPARWVAHENLVFQPFNPRLDFPGSENAVLSADEALEHVRAFSGPMQYPAQTVPTPEQYCPRHHVSAPVPVAIAITGTGQVGFRLGIMPWAFAQNSFMEWDQGLGPDNEANWVRVTGAFTEAPYNFTTGDGFITRDQEYFFRYNHEVIQADGLPLRKTSVPMRVYWPDPANFASADTILGERNLNDFDSEDWAVRFEENFDERLIGPVRGAAIDELGIGLQVFGFVSESRAVPFDPNRVVAGPGIGIGSPVTPLHTRLQNAWLPDIRRNDAVITNADRALGFATFWDAVSGYGDPRTVGTNRGGHLIGNNRINTIATHDPEGWEGRGNVLMLRDWTNGVANERESQIDRYGTSMDLHLGEHEGRTWVSFDFLMNRDRTYTTATGNSYSSPFRFQFHNSDRRQIAHFQTSSASQGDPQTGLDLESAPGFIVDGAGDDVVQPYENRWMRFDVIFDFDAGYYDVYLNGAIFLLGVEIPYGITDVSYLQVNTPVVNTGSPPALPATTGLGNAPVSNVSNVQNILLDNIRVLGEIAPTVILTPDTVTVNDGGLTATSTVSGTAEGEIILDTSDLPIGVTATVNQATGAITVTGVRPTTDVPPITGTFHIEITREGVTETLPVTVNLTTTWAPPSTDADLSGLRVVSEDADEDEVVHALDPAFSPAVLAYTVNVLHAVTEIEIDAAAVCPDAAVVITRPAADPEDDPVVVEGPAALALGENVFTITVTAADGETVRVYTVTVTRGAEIEEHLAFMFGNDEGHFMPRRNATRADVAAILARVKLLEFERGIEELPAGMSAFTAFSDVDEDDWFYYYVAWAYDAGLVRGDDTGRFRPHDPITRQEFAAMLARTLDAYEEEAGQMSFRDAGTITSWATHYVYTVYSMGWMVGDDAGNFNPLFYTARADVATAMNRILGRIDSRAALNAADVENQSYARNFPDVAATAWYFPSVMAAANDHRLTRDAEDAIDWKYIIRPATP